MLADFTFKLAGETYTVCYTARARYLFELEASYPLQELRAFKGRMSDAEQTRLLWAGLEGARARSKSRKNPWTVAEVLDEVLADVDADARVKAVSVCLDAVTAAFATTAPHATEEVAAGAEGKPQTTV